ncbi:superoxide dismutase family protein [Sporosarcina pasteurii]|nr:superoxide dismutase family protein [Sporosarcina pasteurii]
MIKAPLINTEGTEMGEVTITEDNKGVTIRVVAEGLTPGTHGFHIHEKGECTPPTFESAGGHFNPTNKEHGFENPKGFHLGDLPNIQVEKDGTIDATVTTAEVTLQKGKENSILDEDGSTIMIHENADDYKTDPAGNAGDRIACAVIE